MSVMDFAMDPRYNPGATRPDIFGTLGTLLGGPVMPGVDAQTAKALQTQALLRAGLGMMAGSESGMGFGQSGLQGLGLASGNYMQAMQNAFSQRMLSKREDRDERAFKRAGEQFDREAGRADRAEDRAERIFQFDKKMQQDALSIRIKEANATIAAAQQGQAVDAQKLSDARQLASFGMPLLEKLARGEALTESEEALLNVFAGGTPQGMTSARTQGQSLWGGAPMILPPGGGSGNPLLADPDL